MSKLKNINSINNKSIVAVFYQVQSCMLESKSLNGQQNIRVLIGQQEKRVISSKKEISFQQPMTSDFFSLEVEYEKFFLVYQ